MYVNQNKIPSRRFSAIFMAVIAAGTLGLASAHAQQAVIAYDDGSFANSQQEEKKPDAETVKQRYEQGLALESGKTAQGTPVERDIVKAYENYLFAAKNGHTRALLKCMDLCVFYRNFPFETNPPGSFFERVSQIDDLIQSLISLLRDEDSFLFMGFPKKDIPLITACLNGYGSIRWYGIETNDEKVEKLTLFAQSGETTAMLILGRNMFLDSQSVPDFDKARSYYTKAIEAGNSMGKLGLAEMELYGTEEKANESAALKLSLEATPIPENEIQCALGMRIKQACSYWRGYQYTVIASAQQKWEKENGNSSDDGPAFYYALRWFLKSAQGGNALAMCEAAKILNTEDFSAYNPEEAFSWFKKADEKGNPNACYELGNFYYKGDFVPPDGDKALAYYLKFAQTNSEGYKSAAAMYLSGLRFPVDEKKAWFYALKGENGEYDAAAALIASLYSPIVHEDEDNYRLSNPSNSYAWYKKAVLFYLDMFYVYTLNEYLNNAFTQLMIIPPEEMRFSQRLEEAKNLLEIVHAKVYATRVIIATHNCATSIIPQVINVYYNPTRYDCLLKELNNLYDDLHQMHDEDFELDKYEYDINRILPPYMPGINQIDNNLAIQAGSILENVSSDSKYYSQILSAFSLTFTPWLESKAEEGNVNAMVTLVTLSERFMDFAFEMQTRIEEGEINPSSGGLKDYKHMYIEWENKYILWLKCAANYGNAAMQYRLAVLYSYGGNDMITEMWGLPPIEQDKTQALYWFQRAAENGCDDAWDNLCEYYISGTGTPINYVKAAYWLRYAFLQSQKNSFYQADYARQLAELYFNRGVCDTQGAYKALYWYETQWKSEIKHGSTNNIAYPLFLIYGPECVRNEAKGMDLIKSSAQRGNDEAKKYLDNPKNPFPIITKKTLADSAMASYLYAWRRITDAQAAPAWETAALLGDSQAINHLVYFYLESPRFQPDKTEKVQTFTLEQIQRLREEKAFQVLRRLGNYMRETPGVVEFTISQFYSGIDGFQTNRAKQKEWKNRAVKAGWTEELD